MISNTKDKIAFLQSNIEVFEFIGKLYVKKYSEFMRVRHWTIQYKPII